MAASWIYGALGIPDTIAANRTYLSEYGLQTAAQGLARLLAAHNAIMNEMVTQMCDISSDRLRKYGGAASGDWDEADSYNSPDVAKVANGVDVGFPLRKFQYGIGWNRDYFKVKTVEDWAKQLDAATTAHRVRVEREIKRALFTNTSNTTYVDRLVDKINLPIRALVNADSTEIPPDPWGNAFDASTHTHYIAKASLDAAHLTAIIAHVREHYNTGQILVYINQASESTVRNLTGFNAYVDARIVQPYTATYAGNQALDIFNVYNRAIGIYDGAEIWVKPWIPANYQFAFNPSQNKPLVLRTRTGTWAGMQVAYEFDEYPMNAQFMEDEFGIGVWERTNGVCSRSNNGTYAIPTI